MKNETYTIYDILQVIKKRPGMYIGEISLKSMKTYIHGYEMAMSDAKVKDKSYPEFRGFHEFVKETYGYFESTAGWANMILATTIGLTPENISWEGYDDNVTFEQHKKSIERFYALLNEFKNQNGK